MEHFISRFIISFAKQTKLLYILISCLMALAEFLLPPIYIASVFFSRWLDFDEYITQVLLCL